MYKKYNEHVVKVIIETLKETGDRPTAWKAAKICTDTFYQWLKHKPEFAEAVLAAEKEYRDRLPQACREQAQKAFLDYLFGRVVERWDINEDGKHITREIKRGVPQWAIERALGKPGSILDAVNILIDEGLLDDSILSVVQTKLESNLLDLKSLLSEEFRKKASS